MNNRISTLPFIITVFIGSLLTLLLTTSAYAHRVTVFAWVENGTIFTQSKFGAGGKVNNGKVTVYDNAGQELLNGRTDANGEFSFPVPAKDELMVVLDATMGHRAEWTIAREEISAEPPLNSPTTTRVIASDREQATAQSSRQLEATLEKVLDRKLKPIHHMLAEMNQTGPSLQDIIAGLGYIAGLIGIAAWVHARRLK